MKRFLSLIVLAALLGTFSQANAFELRKSLSNDLQPKMSIMEDDTGITVNYSFSGAMISEDDLFPGTFNFAIPGFGNNMTGGEAAYPTRWDSFEIPYGCEASVTLQSSEFTEYDMHMAPAREPLFDNDDSGYSLDNVEAVKDFAEWMPASLVTDDGIQTYRDRDILYVGIFPVQYSKKDGKVRVAETLSFRIDFTRSMAKAQSEDGEMVRHDVDADFMNSVFTHTLASESDTNGMEKIGSIMDWKDGEGYLILTVPQYEEAVNRFAAWKRMQGFNVEILSMPLWLPNSIKLAVHQKYVENPTLTHLLLFGDEDNIIPEKIENSDFQYQFYSDYNYACMDGIGDTVQDITIGRISVTNISEANAVVDKIIQYEKYPKLCSKGLHCAEFSDTEEPYAYEDRRYTRTVEDILIAMRQLGKNIQRVYNYNGKANHVPLYWNNGNYGYGEPLPSELTSSSFNWKGSASDIVRKINDGVDYVIHRDHGDINGWSNPSFTTVNINDELRNRDAIPFVFSLNCSSGMFKYLETWITVNKSKRMMARPIDWIDDNKRSTCFAEAFLRKRDGGAVGVIAASQLSYTAANEVLAMEMFQTMWPSVNFRYPFTFYNPDYSMSYTKNRMIGKILNIGTSNLNKYLRGNNQVRNAYYNSMIYHCFGDPTMKFHDENPLKLTIKRTQLVSSNSLIYETGINVLLSRINKETGAVSTCMGNRFVIDMNDFEEYVFYVNHDQITTLYLGPTSIIDVNELISIEKITYLPGNISICMDGIDNPCNGSVKIQSVDDPSCFRIRAIENDKEVTVSTEGCKSGIYVVDLIIEDVVCDSKKIIIK